MADQGIEELLAILTKKQAELVEQQAELVAQQKETDRQLRETDLQQKETGRQQKETGRQMQETDRQLRELGRQLGGLGDKFGSFTEGLALPSMTKILMQRFGMLFVAPRVKMRRNDRTMEIDVLAYSNSEVNAAYIVEVKSHLREDGLDQLRKILREFRNFFPDHAGKKLYGILAAVDIQQDVAEKALREGIYLARIHDGQFDLQVPEDFQPRAY